MDSDYENFITDTLKQLEVSINSSNAEAAINLIDVIVSNKFPCNITIQQDPPPISPPVSPQDDPEPNINKLNNEIFEKLKKNNPVAAAEYAATGVNNMKEALAKLIIYLGKKK